MSSKTAACGLAAALLLAGSGAGIADGLTAINPRSAYPEGPVAAFGAVYYAEMGADRVMRWDGATSVPVWKREGCWPTSVARGGAGILLVLCHREAAILTITPDGTTVAIVDRDDRGRPFVNPNASVNDDKGGVYLSASGDFAPGAPAMGAILYLDVNGRLSRVAEGIRYANGVALTPDGSILYASEHLSRRVLAFDVAADGSLSGGRVFLQLDDVVGVDPARGWEVGPDGLAVDRRGNVYIAEYGGGRVVIVDRDAKSVATIDVPEKYTTAVALIDDERRIFITAPVSLYDPGAFGKVYVVDNPAYRGD